MVWLILLVIVGVVVGGLAGPLTEGRGLGILGSIVLGLAGSFLGGFLFALVGERLVGPLVFHGSAIAAIVGAIGLILVVNLVKR